MKTLCFASLIVRGWGLQLCSPFPDSLAANGSFLSPARMFIHALTIMFSSCTLYNYPGEIDSSINSNSSVVIVGVVIAILLALLLLSFGVYIALRHYRRQKRKPDNKENLEHTSSMGNPAYFGKMICTCL